MHDVASPRALPARADRGVAGQAVQPRSPPPAVAKLADPLPNRRPHLLRDIVHALPVAQDSEDHPAHPPISATHEFLERIAIAAANGLDYRLFGVKLIRE